MTESGSSDEQQDTGQPAIQRLHFRREVSEGR